MSEARDAVVLKLKVTEALDKAARLPQIDHKTIHTKVKEYGIAVGGKEKHGKGKEI